MVGPVIKAHWYMGGGGTGVNTHRLKKRALNKILGEDDLREVMSVYQVPLSLSFYVIFFSPFILFCSCLDPYLRHRLLHYLSRFLLIQRLYHGELGHDTGEPGD